MRVVRMFATVLPLQQWFYDVPYVIWRRKMQSSLFYFWNIFWSTQPICGYQFLDACIVVVPAPMAYSSTLSLKKVSRSSGAFFSALCHDWCALCWFSFALFMHRDWCSVLDMGSVVFRQSRRCHCISLFHNIQTFVSQYDKVFPASNNVRGHDSRSLLSLAHRLSSERSILVICASNLFRVVSFSSINWGVMALLYTVRRCSHILCSSSRCKTYFCRIV